jgi:hypothetical protein
MNWLRILQSDRYTAEDRVMFTKLGYEFVPFLCINMLLYYDYFWN